MRRTSPGFLTLSLAVIPVALLLSSCRGSSEGNVEVDLDEDEGTVTITGEDGAVMTGGGGEDRPASAPEDLPSADGARNFSWLEIAGNQVLGFEVRGDYRELCDDQTDLLLSAGWEQSDAFAMEADGATIRSFVKADSALTLTCGDNTEEGSSFRLASIAMNRVKQ